MHYEVEQFLKSDVIQRIGWNGTDTRVVEVGSYFVNGAARTWFPLIRHWTGLDLMEGRGVDIVGDANETLPPLVADTGRFHRAVCIEVLEHAPEWRKLVLNMHNALHVGGFLVLTCASSRRPPHSAYGADALLPGEYYEGVDAEALHDLWLTTGGTVWYLADLWKPGDTQALLKRELPEDAVA